MLKIICTQAVHTSNKPCRIETKEQRDFGCTAPERATEVFQIRDRTLRHREH